MANEPACPQAPGSETTGHRWGFDKSRSLWTSRRLGVVFGEEAAAGIPASPIPQQACPIVMCRIVGSQHREQARRCTISSLLPRCSRPTDLDPLIVKEGMRTHQPSVSRSRRDTPSVGATSSSARVSAEVSIPPHGRFGSVGLNGGNRRSAEARDSIDRTSARGPRTDIRATAIRRQGLPDSVEEVCF